MKFITELLSGLLDKSQFDRIVLYILFLANLTYTIWLVMIAHISPLVGDDIQFAIMNNENGLIRNIGIWYANWQGRFGPQALIHLIVDLEEGIGSLAPYNLALVALFVYSIFRIFQRVTQSIWPEKVFSNFVLFNFSWFLFNVFLISHLAIQTFFFLTASTMYFGGLAFALLGFSEVLSESKKAYSYLFILLSFTYAASSAENFGAVLILLLLVILAFRELEGKFWQVSSKIVTSKLAIALVVSAISFIIMIAAPGNSIRRENFPEPPGFWEMIMISMNSTKAFLRLLIFNDKLILILCFLPLATYLGTSVKRKCSMLAIDKGILTTSLLMIPFVFSSFIPMAYAMSEMGPKRATVFITFYLILSLFLIAFLVGLKIRFAGRILKLATLVSCTSLLAFSIYEIKSKVNDTVQYVESIERREQVLLGLKEAGQTGTVVLEPLVKKDRNVLHCEDIDPDSSSYRNLRIMKYYDLPFYVKTLQKEVPENQTSLQR